ncbi:MAG: hypothetical protein K8F34_16335 [Candidatus Kuenenia stuttgartiensis]|nr:hypothetical protein [Candidatus Kuenenia stuttgartiensis]
MAEDESLKDIITMEKVASEVLALKNDMRQRRPIVIEFCGSPKSGKTSCITSLNIFLKRNGYKTRILTERASVCPISDKHNPLFNIWTACSSIAGISEHISSGVDKVDIIIADRGIFDSLCWFEWQYSKRYLDCDSFNALKKFLTMKFWRRYVDLIYVFKVEPEISMEREYANLLTRKTGSIMNKEILNEYNQAINRSVTNYKSLFKYIDTIDTGSYSQNEVNYMVTKQTLSTLSDMLDEKIGYFNSSLNDIGLEIGINDTSKLRNQKLNFLARLEVEKKDTVQPIPIAVVTNAEKNKVLVLKKQEKSVSENSPEKDRLLIYAGGHMRKEDKLEDDSDNVLDIAKNTLSREIKEELGVSIIPDETEPFLIYSPENEISKKHLAICYVITADFNNTKFKLDHREIVQKKGKTKSGQILPIDELLRDHKESLETWSLYILEKVFDSQKLRKPVQILLNLATDANK